MPTHQKIHTKERTRQDLHSLDQICNSVPKIPIWETLEYVGGPYQKSSTFHNDSFFPFNINTTQSRNTGQG